MPQQPGSLSMCLQLPLPIPSRASKPWEFSRGRTGPETDGSTANAWLSPDVKHLDL